MTLNSKQNDMLEVKVHDHPTSHGHPAQTGLVLL